MEYRIGKKRDINIHEAIVSSKYTKVSNGLAPSYSGVFAIGRNEMHPTRFQVLTVMMINL